MIELAVAVGGPQNLSIMAALSLLYHKKLTNKSYLNNNFLFLKKIRQKLSFFLIGFLPFTVLNQRCILVSGRNANRPSGRE